MWPRWARLSGSEVRARIRAGLWRQPTAGVALGWAQANLVIVPAAHAASFLGFWARNPRPCPQLEVTEPGSAEPLRLAPGADVRTDLPRYRVYRDGAVVREPDDIVEYRTNRQCHPAGPFHGRLVVSMRPIPDSLVEVAVQVSSKFPLAHGGPVHVGDPAGLGIADLAVPDYGDAVPVGPGETPVFWACGVTPQASAEAARLPLMITHAPGYMFVTDLRDRDLGDAEVST